MESYRLYRLENAKDFEEMARKCAEKRFNTHFFPYGKNGEKQHGIDLRNHDASIVVQCKNYSNYNHFLNQIEKDYLSAINYEEFKNIKKFVVFTALSNNGKAHDELIKLQNKHSDSGVEIEPFFWEDVEKLIFENEPLRKRYDKLRSDDEYSEMDATDYYCAEFDAPLFLHQNTKEKLSLHDLYVSPAKIEWKKKVVIENLGTADIQTSSPYVTDAINEFLTFDKSMQYRDRVKLLFIEGPAASGKSSLFSWLCWHYEHRFQLPTVPLSFENRRLIAIQLRSFYSEKSIDCNNPLKQICDILSIKKEILQCSLLLLDGFDELCMIDKLQNVAVRTFFKTLSNQLQGFDCKIIVTSRPGLFEIESLDFRYNKISLCLFDKEMRKKWIENYKKKFPLSETVEHLLLEEENGRMGGLIDSPLTMYMVASTNWSKGVLNAEPLNRWSLFDCILRQEPVDREYAKGVSHPTADYREVLHHLAERIAHEMASKEKLFLIGEMVDRLIDQQSCEEISPDKLKQCLGMAVYLKTYKSDSYAVEFYHNNIRDYYLCEYIWDRLKTIYEKINENDPIEYLCREMTALFSDTWYLTKGVYGTYIVLELLESKLSYFIAGNNTVRFIKEEKASNYFPTFFTRMVSRGMLDQYEYDGNHDALETMHGIFWSVLNVYLTMYRFFLSKDEMDNKINLFDHDCPEWQRVSLPTNGILCTMFTRKSFANSQGINLRQTDLSGIDLTGTNLSSADFQEGKLSRINLDHADIKKANLIRADLHMASLYFANLSGAKLIDADLRNAYLAQADLSGADLRGAKMTWTNLSKTDLSGADLRGALLNQGTHFTDAIIKHTKITKDQIQYFGTKKLVTGADGKKQWQWQYSFDYGPDAFVFEETAERIISE